MICSTLPAESVGTRISILARSPIRRPGEGERQQGGDADQNASVHVLSSPRCTAIQVFGSRSSAPRSEAFGVSGEGGAPKRYRCHAESGGHGEPVADGLDVGPLAFQSRLGNPGHRRSSRTKERKGTSAAKSSRARVSDARALRYRPRRRSSRDDRSPRQPST
jgi:hypothetical protein